MPFLDEIAARLVSKGVGSINTSIFMSSRAKLPVGDGPYLTLVETGGGGSSKTQNDTATEHSTAQLMAHAKSYPTARAMLVAAYNALGGANGLYNVTLNGVFYLSIKARQPPTDTGLDPAGLPSITFNIEVEKEPS
jgi:hypothetical protein